MKYKVELDVYCGPLDLLLHLLKRDELEIQKIPVARVADQFVSYLDNIADIDIEIAGDFLVMAARLTEMKSRSLLPTITTEDEDIDPDLIADETDLIQRLLEYRVFKDISRKLRRNSELRAFRFGRAMFPEFVETPQDDADILEGVTIMDMFSAFQRIAKEVQLEESRTIFYDDVPIERHIERVLEKLTSAGAFAFSHIIPKGVRKAYIIGAFIALLELVKQKKISLAQEEDFQDITIDEHVMPPALPEDDEDAIQGAEAPAATDESVPEAEHAEGYAEPPPADAREEQAEGLALDADPTTGEALEPVSGTGEHEATPPVCEESETLPLSVSGAKADAEFDSGPAPEPMPESGEGAPGPAETVQDEQPREPEAAADPDAGIDDTSFSDAAAVPGAGAPSWNDQPSDDDSAGPEEHPGERECPLAGDPESSTGSSDLQSGESSL